MRQYPPTQRPQRRASRRKSSLRILASIVFFSLFLLMGVFIFSFRNNEPEYVPAIVPVEELPQDEDVLQLVPTPRVQLRDTGYLKLVNRYYYITSPMDYSNIVYAWPTVAVRATDITVHQTLLNAVSALFATAEGRGPFFVTSGYRSVARQAEIYENAVDRMYVLPPGHSEHNLGLAADILVTDVPMSQMSGTPEAIWLAQNAWRYGLVLRYPYGTTHITGVAYEPWHFRYVGRVHAWYMTTRSMVLEEYLEFLEESGGFAVELEGVEYHVIYQQDGESIYVPETLPFTLSKSNRGGYVVTVAIETAY